MFERLVTIENQRGLHARASAKLVRLAQQFDARIYVVREGERVAASSIMGLMMLAAGRGMEIMLQAEGNEAQAALDALAALVANKFNEE